MKKIAILLVFLIVLNCFAGCEQNQTSTETPSAAPDSTSSTATPTVPSSSVTQPVHQHEWRDATCLAPKSCVTCGTTEGDLADHSWDEGVIIKEPTEEEDGEKRYTCAICGETKLEIIVALGHEHHYDEATMVNPTCIEGGYTIHTCRCGDRYIADETPALGHDWSEASCVSAKTCRTCGETGDNAFGHTWQDATCENAKTCTVCGEKSGQPLKHDYSSIITKPTCTAQGYTTYTCNRCNDNYVSDYVAANGHTWTGASCTEAKTCTICQETEGTAKGHSWIAATCTEAKTCSTCKQTEGTALGHSYGHVVTKPTCTAQGYTTHTCNRCSDSYIADHVAANGHTWTDATCTEAKTCAICQATEGSAKGHSWDGGKIITDATEYEAGQMLYTCTVCAKTNAQAIPPLGHTHSYTAVVTPATCTTAGFTTHVCRCGDSYITDGTSALGHEWIAATCTEAKTCSTCKQTEGTALGHSYGHVVTKPTCTAQGYTTHTCNRCSDSYIADHVAANGHTWKGATCTEAKTCAICKATEGTAKGHSWDAATCLKAKTCSTCKQTEGAALGHSYEHVVIKPTCTEEGYTTHTCKRCNDQYISETVAILGHDFANATCTTPKTCRRCTHTAGNALGHSYGDWYTATEPTCTQDGTQRHNCIRCTHFENRSISAKGHAYNAVVTDPTCTAQGYTTYTCSHCANQYTASYVNAKGHGYDGELDDKCNACGAVREVDKVLLDISQSSVFGYVRGLVAKRRSATSTGRVILYNSTNSYATDIGIYGEYFFKDVPAGTYYLKIEASGYHVPEPVKVEVSEDGHIMQHMEVAVIIGNDFYYHWWADESYFGYEESANVPAEKTFTFLDEELAVNDSQATAKLQREYQIVLSDEELKWSSDYASRMLELVDSIYEFPRQNPSKWILVDYEIDDDVKITYAEDHAIIYISKATFENATPRKAEYGGLKGTYFSNRLYHALIRYATKEGTDIYYVDSILRNDYGCSIIVEDYAALTAGITNETNAAFEMFKPKELLAILEMFAEMPQGLHRIENLEYLVRRIDASVNPIYPDAAAISWIGAEHGYIEFIDVAFLGSEVEDTFRLILHEKAHFLWAHVFSEELKAKWIEIGGWYQTSTDTEDGWSTSKETEFVTAYAHAHNPDEDMAESIAYYILMPNRLESRSPEKYAFIRDYIMNGEIYMSQIREDLTFEVYNLYPDYNYPGRIVGIDVQVSGAPEEDKLVTVTVTLDTHGDPTFGASGGFMRIFSDVDTYFDLGVSPIDETMSVLQGSITVSKHAFSGYWHNEQITLTDAVGNPRFVGVDNFGWKLYINNPLADLECPQYEKDSMYVEMEPGEIDGRQVTYIHIKFRATDNLGIGTVMCSFACNTSDGYRVDSYGSIDNETGEAIIKCVFTEYMHSGEYSINFLSLVDFAGNRSNYYFYADGSGDGYPTLFYYNSENSDYEAPELDVNKITITATPTHPENPNGETLVNITYYVRDNASGLGTSYFMLLDPLGRTFGAHHYHENFFTMFFEGDPTEWRKYEVSIILPEGSAPGIWGLLEFHLYDKAGNFEAYNFLEIVHFQVSSTNMQAVMDSGSGIGASSMDTLATDLYNTTYTSLVCPDYLQMLPRSKKLLCRSWRLRCYG